jgi:hypothetical protein
MPTAETERQKTERLLREQLARIEQAKPAEDHEAGRRAGLFRRLRRRLPPLSRKPASPTRPLAGPKPVRWTEQLFAAARGRLPPWRAGKRKVDRLAELQEGIEALRGARALDELYAAAAADPPSKAAGRRRSELPASAPAHGAAMRKNDLPNGSGGGPKLPGMKEAPAREWGPPPKVQFPKPDKKKDRRSDLVIAALGVALGLTCALFPWYIFFNQEQFGVQAIAFGGHGHNAGRIMVDPRTGGDVAEALSQQMPKNIDLFSTGTVQPKPETPKDAPSLDQQPFPAEAAKFRLVHVANGRAMIEDDAGLWIVQQGSSLPDSTRVKSIEKRKGQWVLVTSADRVIEISE